MYIVTPIKALSDNYIWAISQYELPQVVIVDPGEAKPVLEYIQNNNLKLSAILLTHHHADHTGGVAEILRHFDVGVFGAKSQNMPLVSDYVGDGTRIEITDHEFSLQLHTMAVPAHTLDHMAYFNRKVLFCGDTLFTGGCGKVFEGTPQQMYDALTRLAGLPGDTQIYCGHEYTINNLKFAQMVEPENDTIQMRMRVAIELQELGIPTVPALLSLELLTNPFLRSNIPEVKIAVEQYTGITLDTPVEVFAALREWKNSL